VALAAVALVAAGCVDYTIETTVRPDGTGVRVERMEVTRNDDYDMAERDFRALTGATGQTWRTSTRVDPGGDTVWVLERRAEVGRLRDWSDPVARALILAVPPERAEERLGYVRLGDVVYRSSVQVGVTRRSDGTSLVSYRERFLWDQAADALVEFIVQDLDRALAERYPRLSEGERGAILGFARARIWLAGDEGLFAGENEEQASAEAAARTAEHAVKIIRARYPGVQAAELRTLLLGLLSLEGEDVDRRFTEALPGVNLGINTEVVFRLTLPGTAGTNNADTRDGNTLEWTFSPLDDLTTPVEVFAEAVVGG
jgi:hypothetical protein